MMGEQRTKNEKDSRLTVLLIDDEDRFREALSRQLTNRGFNVLDTSNGDDAIKIVRHENPEVVILDQKMPGMDGIQTLKELKKIRPEVQVIMHTGHGSIEAARITGKHDVFHYLEKPCGIDELLSVINAAAEERIHALARHEIPEMKRSNLKEWLIGVQNARPGVIMLGVILFAIIALMPIPRQLETFLTAKKTGEMGENISGYSEYQKMEKGQTISDYYAQKAKLHRKVKTEDGKVVKVTLGTEKIAFRAKVMVGVLVVAALFWATGAIPIGVTALLVGVLMYFFGVFPPSQVAKAYAKDSVVFIFGVLALAAAISKTGLDRRIGILLLGTSTSLRRFGLIFGPLLAVTASFLSEHALVAFIAPILMLVYMGTIKSAGLKKDRGLVVMLLLMLTYCANIGGPGSPAAGGRNAVMLGIFSDYGIDISFGQWMKMGLPFVPVMALVIAGYFLLVFRKRVKVKSVNIAEQVGRESEKIGKMTPDEYKAAGVLLLVIVLWTTLSSRFGMGGPVLLCLVLLNILGILRWKDINGIHWDVVALYAAASAMGYGLACTGAALWLANSFMSILPEFLKSGTGLCISTSFITGILTNFMSDGATVAAVGPITVPMATLSGTSPLMVGLATAFASSFAHMLIIGTPNNAIVYSMAKDPETGEQLVTMKDFFIHGFMIFLLSLAVLWLWVFFGYWRWVGIPGV
jgi:sodium-dependent dicarboxylate transporter 2/3/5